MSVAVLFARRDSIYKSMPAADVFDADRDALTYRGGMPVVAHPPCRAWGQLRHFAKPRPGERDLAPWAVSKVRECGGVLEHPRGSQLWPELPLPQPGEVDAWGGWTLPIWQSWWGHRAEKATYLYIVGCRPADLPLMPLRLGDATHVIARSRRKDGTRVRKGMTGWRPECAVAEREHTPPALAAWLVDLAGRCKV